MPRQIPDCPKAPIISSQHSDINIKTDSFDIHVVTPLFGGGVKASENDPITVIRGSSIRGHLRFWWRATRGAAFETWKDLRKAEEEIWGSSEKASKVNIQISISRQGRAIKCAEFNKPNSTFPSIRQGYPPYVIFPFLGKAKKHMGSIKIEEEPATAREDVLFTLKVAYPSHLQNDVYAALWAWINFGGIGARTRRGCGSLYNKDFSPSEHILKNRPKLSEEIRKWYADTQRKYQIFSPETKRTWPVLPKQIFVLRHAAEHISIWNKCILKLQSFRQGANVGRNPGEQPNRPGRSRWPEAESARIIFEQRDDNRPVQDFMPTPLFPRSLFGLPIILHFKDRGDPRDVTITPNHPDITDTQRLSSAIIIKPLACSIKESVGLTAPLFTEFAKKIHVKSGHKPPIPYDLSNIVSSRMAEMKNSPFRAVKDLSLQKQAKNGNPIAAFLNYFSQE